MKTIVILFALATLNVAAFAQKSLVKYVLTNTDTLICTNIKMRTNTAKCVLLSGEKISVPKSDIIAYSNYGRVMKKLPVYKNGKKTNEFDMMEFVANSNRVEVYKHVYYNDINESLDAVFNYYYNNEYIYSQKNPDVTDIKEFLSEFQPRKTELLTVE